MTKSARNELLVSCWNQSIEESWRMWREYADGSKGVMVVSTPERIMSALDIWKNDDEMAWFCQVRYLGSRALERLGHQAINPVSVAFIKRPRFAWEAECRLALSTHTPTPKGLAVDLNQLIERIVVGHRGDASAVAALVAQHGLICKVVPSGVERA